MTSQEQDEGSSSSCLRGVLAVWALSILLTASLAGPSLADSVASSAAGSGKKAAAHEAHGEDDHEEEAHGNDGHGDGDHSDDGHAEAEHGDDGHGKGGHGGHGSSRLSDEKTELQLEGFPQRPKPILELGEPFLGTGTLAPGITLPTGAVWQPSLLLFGNVRTALQTFDSGVDSVEDSRVTEWANRLDLFFNLQLSGSERLVVGIRALDEAGRFTSYFFENPNPELDGDFQDELDLNIETLFFEGDFGEIFPNLDVQDFGSTDIGFSIGRQPISFQEGILINDVLDGVGLTRNTLQPKNMSNLRSTLFVSWNDIDAGAVERDGTLYGLLTSMDLRKSTVDVDVFYVDTDDGLGSLITGGISAVQRIGKTNAAFRLLASSPSGQETALATEGYLFFSELSWIPHYTHDLVYLNTFWAVDEFSSAARAPDAGGPLGRAGINFAAVGLGSYAAPLSNRARDAVGLAFGYQKFLDDTRKQVLTEVATRIATVSDGVDAASVTVRYQAAIGRRMVFVLDGFVGYEDNPLLDISRNLYGGRVELQVKF